jgi:hypothetical protein
VDIIKRLNLLLLLVPAIAFADDAGLLHCRGIAESTARLACYDAIQLAPPGAAATPSAPAKATPEKFGLEQRAPKPAEQLDEIQSTIPGHFEDVRTGAIVRLANGQVWQIVDGNTRLYDLNNPKVAIRRGMLGAFYLDIENDKRSLRVVRVQ